MRMTPKRDEQGSMIIALTVIMVLGALAVTVTARTLSGQDSARRNQEFSGALGVADAGVSDALFRVDQLGNGAPPATFCVGGSVNCTVQSLPGSVAAQYVATKIDDFHVRVRSKGLVNGVPHAVEAILVRDQLYPFALFGDASLTFNGSSNGTIYSVDASGATVTTPSADAGSNGSITCNSNSHPASHHIVYPGGSSNCPDRIDLTGSYKPKDPVVGCPAPVNTPPTPCVPPTAQACPAVSGVIPAVLNPGQYLCTSTISFGPTFQVGTPSSPANGGVVEIFVIPPAGSTADVYFNGSDLNVNPVGNIEGDPTKFRVYLAGHGIVDPGNGSNAGRWVGIIYAPSSDMTSNGCKADWRGALTFHTATCNGGPNLRVRYDSRVAALTQQNWSVHDYREIPSTQVVLP
ncbi:MAG: hypothetical protein QOF60_2421 [Actinomycetota bacterium]|jgi:hypothetical protein|nr:hypothetical protein [Actinomycetota bacterium]